MPHYLAAVWEMSTLSSLSLIMKIAKCCVRTRSAPRAPSSHSLSLIKSQRVSGTTESILWICQWKHQSSWVIDAACKVEMKWQTRFSAGATKVLCQVRFQEPSATVTTGIESCRQLLQILSSSSLTNSWTPKACRWTYPASLTCSWVSIQGEAKVTCIEQARWLNSPCPPHRTISSVKTKYLLTSSRTKLLTSQNTQPPSNKDCSSRSFAASSPTRKLIPSKEVHKMCPTCRWTRC